MRLVGFLLCILLNVVVEAIPAATDFTRQKSSAKAHHAVLDHATHSTGGCLTRSYQHENKRDVEYERALQSVSLDPVIQKMEEHIKVQSHLVDLQVQQDSLHEPRQSLMKRTLAGAIVVPTLVSIPVYVHILSTTEIHDPIVPTDASIHQQFQVLNSDYSTTGFHFELKEILMHNVDERMYLAGPTPEFMIANRQGDKRTMNVYVANLPESFLGWSTMPQDYEDAPHFDGIVLSSSALPNGRAYPFNGGNTLTHEAGHWLGLWHTFQGHCTYPNDFVDDTLPQKTQTEGCPRHIADLQCAVDDFQSFQDQDKYREQKERLDLFLGGSPTRASLFSNLLSFLSLQPSHPHDYTRTGNFLDYADDMCEHFFTPGQIQRMHASWILIRN